MKFVSKSNKTVRPFSQCHEMLYLVLFFNLILCPLVLPQRRHDDKSAEELGGSLVSALRNDANLDLSVDEEYEDLRAELLAYHTALASITEDRADDQAVDDSGKAAGAGALLEQTPGARRSMKTTPCWQLGGICVSLKMCEGYRFLSQVPGCKDRIEVCCFTWNRFKMNDLEGIGNLAVPWSNVIEYGGKGVVDALRVGGKKGKRRKKKTGRLSLKSNIRNAKDTNTQKKGNPRNYKNSKNDMELFNSDGLDDKPVVMVLQAEKK